MISKKLDEIFIKNTAAAPEVRFSIEVIIKKNRM